MNHFTEVRGREGEEVESSYKLGEGIEGRIFAILDLLNHLALEGRRTEKFLFTIFPVGV